MHFNPKSQLPPVECPLIIRIVGNPLKAMRLTYAESKDDDLYYLVDLPQGGQEVIRGRFDWTYP